MNRVGAPSIASYGNAPKAHGAVCFCGCNNTASRDNSPVRFAAYPGGFAQGPGFPPAPGPVPGFPPQTPVIMNDLQQGINGFQQVVDPYYNTMGSHYVGDYMKHGLQGGYHPGMVAAAANNMYNQQQQTAALGAYANNLVQSGLTDAAAFQAQQPRYY